MAPSHRLAAGLSDEGRLASSRLQQNRAEKHHAVRVKKTTAKRFSPMLVMTRRSALGGTIGAAIGTSASAQLPDPYETLISGQYDNKIISLQQAGGQYVGEDFRLGPAPVAWKLVVGNYNKLHGYWIFRVSQHQCWQAQYGGGHALTYWNISHNLDGKPDVPEDFELFNFEAVKKADRTVRIIGAHRNFYVGMTGETLDCKGTAQSAAVFVVNFF